MNFTTGWNTDYRCPRTDKLTELGLAGITDILEPLAF